MFSQGDKIGDYIISKEISSGGMGAVYQATKADQSGTVALKVMLSEFQYDTNHRQRFEREIQIMQSLKHPNIVPIYAYGEDRGVMYLAMKLVRGYSLQDDLN